MYKKIEKNSLLQYEHTISIRNTEVSIWGGGSDFGLDATNNNSFIALSSVRWFALLFW